jgi:hypothetical protein
VIGDRRVTSCVVCGSHDIEARWTGDREVTVTCAACQRIVDIEFDPPDRPDIRARIEVIFDPDDDDVSDQIH